MVVRLSSLEPAHQALLLPQSGPQAIPTDRSTSHHFAAASGHANRSSHTPPFLPLGPGICGQEWAWMPNAVKPPKATTPSLARAVARFHDERSWHWSREPGSPVCHEAVGVVPQRWLSRASAPGVPTSDR